MKYRRERRARDSVRIQVSKTSAGDMVQTKPNVAKQEKGGMEVGDRAMTLNHSSGTITKLDGKYCYVDLDLYYGKVKRFPQEELQSWHRSREYMQMRHISDLHISVYSKESKPKILDGVVVKTGYDFTKEAERRIFGEENIES